MKPVLFLISKGSELHGLPKSQLPCDFSHGSLLTKASAAVYNNLECAKLLIDSGCKTREGVSGYFSKEARSTINGNPIRDITGRQLYCRYKLKKKMAIYFAIENNNLEMVKLPATSFGWYQNHSMEMDPQVGDLVNSSALKDACVAAGGKFTPSRYARTLGYTEIQKYLESEGK